MVNKRQTNIELLRIVAMLMIITLHFLGHGGVLKSFTAPTLSYGVLAFIKGICMVAVNCFILISGYFLINAEFKWSKVAKLLIQIWFYSVLIFVILSATGCIEAGFKDYILALFPVSTNADDFSAAYLLLYILSPFLNKLLLQLDQKQHLTILAILSWFFVILHDLFSFMGTTLEFGGGYGIVWFICLYCTGAYFRRYPLTKISLKKKMLIYVLLGALLPLSCVLSVLCYKVTSVELFWEFKELFYHYNSIFVYPASVALFLCFVDLRIRNKGLNLVISFFAPATYGVYLIHDNRFVRKVLWQFLSPADFLAEKYFWLYMFLCIAVIFILCALIDKGRKLLFQLLPHKWR